MFGTDDHGTVDEPLNGNSAVNASKQWLPFLSKWCRILSTHSMSGLMATWVFGKVTQWLETRALTHFKVGDSACYEWVGLPLTNLALGFNPP